MIQTWSVKRIFSGSSRLSASSISVGDKGYCGFGVNTSGTYYKDWYKYDSVNDVWSTLTSGPGSIRAAVSIAVCGTDIFIIGGHDGSSCYTDVYSFDTTNDTWSAALTVFPGTERKYASCFSIGSKVYYGLGCNLAGDTYYTDFWEYDTVQDSWNQIQSFPDASGRIKTCSWSVGSNGYIGGGQNGSGKLDTLWQYNGDESTWTQKATNTNGAFTSSCYASIGLDCYLVQGVTTGDIYITNMNKYDSNANSWSTVTPEFPYTDRLDGSMFSIKSSLYVLLGGPTTLVNTDLLVHTSRLETPTTLVSTVLSSSSIRLDWIDNATEETGYIIERKRSDEVDFTTLNTLGPSIETYTDSTVDLTLYSYWYRVKAYTTG